MKQGHLSAARKRASSRQGPDPMPAAQPVPGAFGKERPARKAPKETRSPARRVAARARKQAA